MSKPTLESQLELLKREATRYGPTHYKYMICTMVTGLIKEIILLKKHADTQKELLALADARINHKVDELKAEALRTAEEKLRADQLNQQHSTQAALNSEARKELAEMKAPQAVQPVAPQLKANCYSDDNGDYWRDCPDDCDFVEGLKVGDTYELQASIRAWSETFRVTKAPDETSDDYEVELVSSNAPAHPAEGVPAQAVGEMTAERASYFMRRFLKEEKLLGPNEQAALHYVISQLAATQPAAQGMDTGCAESLLGRIQKEIDHAVMNEHRMAPAFGKMHGDPCVRIAHLEATIEGWKKEYPV